MYMHIFLHLDDLIAPGNRPIEPISWLKVFFDSRLQYESSEGLLDFLAFLVQKLWQNNWIFFREIPDNYSSNSRNIWNFLA